MEDKKVRLNEDMAKSKKGKKKKLRLKKSVRRTIGALLLVTALIVAAIPVGNASAVTGDPATGGDPSGYDIIPAAEDIIEDDTYYYHTSGTSITGYEYNHSQADPTYTPQYKYGFPMEGITTDYDYAYYKINMSNMSVPERPTPIFILDHPTASSTTYNILHTFNNPDGYYNMNSGTVDLEMQICYNEDSTVNSRSYDSADGKKHYEITEELQNTAESYGHDYFKVNAKIFEYELNDDGTFKRDDSLNKILGALVSDETFFACKGNATTVSRIADKAFYRLGSLTNIYIPTTISAIGDSAFEGCTNLDNVTLEANVGSIGKRCFNHCVNLVECKLWKTGNLSIIGDGAFADCTRLSSNFTIPNNVSVIGTAAFYGSGVSNPELVSQLSSSNITIGDYAFAECDKLVNFTFPDAKIAGLRSEHTTLTKHKSYGMFAGCDMLAEVEFPVTQFSGSIPVGTFELCPSLLCVHFSRGAVADDNAANEHAFRDASLNFEIWGDAPPCDTYDYAIERGIPYKYKDANGNWVYVYSAGGYLLGYSPNPTGTTLISVIATSSAKPTLKLPDNFVGKKLTQIAPNAFNSDAGKTPTVSKKLVNIELPSTLESIGDSAFEELEKLSSVKFYESEDYGISSGMTIGNRCFYKCGALTNVSFRGNDDSYLEADSTGNVVRHSKDDLFDMPVTSIGTDAFTLNSATGLTFKGKIDNAYQPFIYATQKGNYYDAVNSYPTYITGNPENLKVQFIEDATDPQGRTSDYVMLLSYPDKDTIVQSIYNPVTKLTSTYTVADLAANPQSTLEDEIVAKTANIALPQPIQIIDYIDNKGKEHYSVSAGPSTYTLFQGVEGLETFSSYVSTFPDRTFKNSVDLTEVTYNGDVRKLGATPFIVEPEYKNYSSDPSRLATVNFLGETAPASVDNPYYDSDNSVIYSDDTADYWIEECLPGRIGTIYDVTNDSYLPNVSAIKENAFENCDGIREVSFDGASKLNSLPERCFYDCDNLLSVDLADLIHEVGHLAFADSDPFSAPTKINDGIKVTARDIEIDIADDAFKYDESPILYSYRDSAAERYHDRVEKYPYFKDFKFIPLDDLFLVKFLNSDGTLLSKQYVKKGAIADVPPNPTMPKKTFIGWKPDDPATYPITENIEFVAQYEDQFDSFLCRFIDSDGNIYGQDIVSYGEKATPPSDPQVSGKKFKKWYPDPDTYIITEDKDFTAIFEESFTVTFEDPDGNPIKVDTVASGEYATAPTNLPKIDGMKFHHWVPDPKQTVILQDTVFKAIYNSTKKSFKATFLTHEGDTWSVQEVEAGNYATEPPGPPRTGYTFASWRPVPAFMPITKNTTFRPVYTPDVTPTPTPSPTPSPSPSPTTSSSSTGSSSSSGSSSSGSSSSSMAYPYLVTSQDAGGGMGGNVAGDAGVNTVVIPEYTPVDGADGSGSGSGNTRVESDRDGISNPDKMSATVNGSTDNYVIKITRTQEADDCALAALMSVYGSDISAIRYLPYDISLYDSTGTNKISPLPEGISVTITMPIPDDLAVYGGNAKVASTIGGQLEPIEPKFTVINDIPCMNYTVTHLSPYMVYVDTANLTEAGISDLTPKTADGLHPKWFLCIGLAALALLLLIKRDPEDYIRKVAA